MTPNSSTPMQCGGPNDRGFRAKQLFSELQRNPEWVTEQVVALIAEAESPGGDDAREELAIYRGLLSRANDSAVQVMATLRAQLGCKAH